MWSDDGVVWATRSLFITILLGRLTACTADPNKILGPQIVGDELLCPTSYIFFFCRCPMGVRVTISPCHVTKSPVCHPKGVVELKNKDQVL